MTALLPLAMVGCGGDSGGGVPGGTIYTGGTNKASVNDANYATVTASVTGFEDAMAVGDALPSKPNAGSGAGMTLADVVRGQLENAARSANASGGAQKMVQSLQPPTDCVDNLANIAGTYQVDLYGFTVTATSISFSGKVTYTGCILPDSTFVDGAVTMSASGSFGDVNTFNSVLVFESLRHYDDPVTPTIDVTLDGGIGMNGSDNTLTGDSSGSITLNFDVIDAISGKEARFANLNLAVTGTTTDESSSMNGRVYVFDPSAGVDGYVDITTTTPLVQLVADLYPSLGGPVILEGSNGGIITITPIDAVDVSVSVDANGDGDFLDAGDLPPTPVPWANL